MKTPPQSLIGQVFRRRRGEKVTASISHQVNTGIRSRYQMKGKTSGAKGWAGSITKYPSNPKGQGNTHIKSSHCTP